MRKYRFVLSVAAIVVILDQLTKWYIRRTVFLGDSIPVIGAFFHITHVRNAGGAFGLFASGNAALRLPFFLLVSLVAVAALLYFVRRLAPQQVVLLFALGSILGGALGNLVDRMVSGAVTDFLDFQWHGYHWPAFNVADSFITIGMLILLLHSLLTRDTAPSQS